MHECPNCGQMTEGAFDEDGARWDVCEDCLQESYYESDSDYLDYKE